MRVSGSGVEGAIMMILWRDAVKQKTKNFAKSNNNNNNNYNGQGTYFRFHEVQPQPQPAPRGAH